MESLDEDNIIFRMVLPHAAVVILLFLLTFNIRIPGVSDSHDKSKTKDDSLNFHEKRVDLLADMNWTIIIADGNIVPLLGGSLVSIEVNS